MPDELKFLSLGLLASVIWAPCVALLAVSTPKVHRSLTRRGHTDRSSTLVSGALITAVLIAYIPLYLLVLFAVLDLVRRQERTSCGGVADHHARPSID